MWKTTRSTSQFGCITSKWSQKPAENKHVGWRRDTGLPCRERAGELEGYKGIVKQEQQTIQIHLKIEEVKLSLFTPF